MRQLRSWALVAIVLAPALGCDRRSGDQPAHEDEPSAEQLSRGRTMMVRDQLQARDITQQGVLDAMGRVPRHAFVPTELRARAYEDRPLPIGYRQTISQPYIVALMTQLADLKAGDRVLEVGTGSGYQAAILAEIGVEVWSIEIIEPLAKQAARRLAALGYDEVHVRHGDGYRGWPEHAPFEAVLVTAAPSKVPEPLKEQLVVGGKLVVPVGDWFQHLTVIERTASGFDERRVISVAFVPMTGEAQK